MNLIKRAFLHGIRKPGKSLLLFLIIVVISTLVLSGLASLDAEEERTTDLRGATGASFTVERNLSTGSWKSDENGSYSTQELITNKMAQRIAEIKGIEAFDTNCTTIFELFDTNNRYIECINPKGMPMVDGQYYTVGTISSEYSSLFLSQSFSMVKGRHITAKDKDAVIISKAIADKHNLNLGDTVNAYNDLTVPLKVIGIFEVVADKSDEKNNYNMASYFDYENYIFMSMEAMIEALKNFPDGPSLGYTSADFFVSDPERLEQIIKNVQAIDGINWNNFTISANNEVYERTENAISNMSSLIRTLIVIIVVISIGIVTLILTMWVKGRMRETGILLSIGIPKTFILMQYIVEVGLISIVAFPLSYLFSSNISGYIGNLFGKTGTILVTTQHFRVVCGFGAMLLAVSIIISSIPSMRLKPKEILSKMS